MIVESIRRRSLRYVMIFPSRLPVLNHPGKEQVLSWWIPGWGSSLIFLKSMVYYITTSTHHFLCEGEGPFLIFFSAMYVGTTWNHSRRFQRPGYRKLIAIRDSKFHIAELLARIASCELRDDDGTMRYKNSSEPLFSISCFLLLILDLSQKIDHETCWELRLNSGIVSQRPAAVGNVPPRFPPIR